MSWQKIHQGLRFVPSLSSTQGHCSQNRPFLLSPTSSMSPCSKPFSSAHKHAVKSAIFKQKPSIWSRLPLSSLFLFPEKLSKVLNLFVVLACSPPVVSQTHSAVLLPSPCHWNRYCQGHTLPSLQMGNSAKSQGQSPVSPLIYHWFDPFLRHFLHSAARTGIPGFSSSLKGSLLHSFLAGASSSLVALAIGILHRLVLSCIPTHCLGDFNPGLCLP